MILVILPVVLVVLEVVLVVLEVILQLLLLQLLLLQLLLLQLLLQIGANLKQKQPVPRVARFSSLEASTDSCGLLRIPSARQPGFLPPADRPPRTLIQSCLRGSGALIQSCFRFSGTVRLS